MIKSRIQGQNPSQETLGSQRKNERMMAHMEHGDLAKISQHTQAHINTQGA